MVPFHGRSEPSITSDADHWCGCLWDDRASSWRIFRHSGRCRASDQLFIALLRHGAAVNETICSMHTTLSCPTPLCVVQDGHCRVHQEQAVSGATSTTHDFESTGSPSDLGNYDALQVFHAAALKCASFHHAICMKHPSEGCQLGALWGPPRNEVGQILAQRSHAAWESAMYAICGNTSEMIFLLCVLLQARRIWGILGRRRSVGLSRFERIERRERIQRLQRLERMIDERTTQRQGGAPESTTEELSALAAAT